MSYDCERISTGRGDAGRAGAAGGHRRDAGRGRWDAIIVGAGHNGLTCAAYLAQGRPAGAGAGGP